MRNILLVARRELQTGIAKKSFIITTLVMVALLVAGIFVLDYFMNRDSGDDSEPIAFTSEAASLIPTLEATATAQGLSLDASTVASMEDGEAAVTEGDVTALVSGTPPQVTVTFKTAMNQTVVQVLASALQAQTMSDQVAALGGDPADFTQALASAVPSINVLERDIEDFGPNYLISIVALSLLLFGLINSGSIISMGVVEEKASRVVEILLATIRPSELFAGKVLGAGVIGLIQLAIYGLAVWAAIQISGIFEGFDVPVGSQFLSILGWFLLGFAAIGTLWGGLSTLVSRQEDVGSVTAPMLILTMLPFYVAIYLVPNAPESTWTTNLSMAPFLAPFVMPIRQVFTDVPLWQVGVAVGLNLAIIPVVVWAAARVYQRAILHTGSRMKLTEAFAKRS